MKRFLAAFLSLFLLAAPAGAQSWFAQTPGAKSAFKPNLSQERRTLRPFPKNFVYENPGLAAPPNQLIEFFVSALGSDEEGVTGLTPGDAFKTVQRCVNHITQYYYMDGTEPICRVINVNGASGTVYNGKIEITGPGQGTQIQGGGQILIWGTCPLSYSPWNDSVGYVAGAADVTLSSDPAVPGQTLFSLINSAYVQLYCFTAKADGYIFYSQQFSNIFINGAVTTQVGPNGSTQAVLSAYNMGQIYVGSLTVAGTAVVAFAESFFNSSIALIGGAGSIVFSGSPTFGQTLLAGYGGNFNIGGGSGVFSGALGGGTGPRCAISYNSTVYAAGSASTIPGTGTCATSAGGQVN